VLARKSKPHAGRAAPVNKMVRVRDLTRNAFMNGDMRRDEPRTVITWAENDEIRGRCRALRSG